MRLFVGLSIPDSVAAGLFLLQGGVPGARWSRREQLHLTLRFIGEVDGRDAAAVDDVLSAISAPRFSLELHAVGTFGGRDPRELWAGVRPNEALMHLQRKIETAIQRIGLAADARKFTPHVTLARLRGSPRGRVVDYLTDHALYASPSFEVNEFLLYSSTLTPNGSIYTQERDYKLR
jgi:RNA 2',3'-cyclic 3'-phosphodiesterase